MIINIKATNIELTEAIRSYAAEKVRTLERVIGPADEDAAIAQVEVGKSTKHHRQGEIFRAEINLEFGGRHLYAAEEKDDLYAAIDAVRDEMTRQINSTIAKRNTLVRRGGRAVKDFLRGLNPWKRR